MDRLAPEAPLMRRRARLNAMLLAGVLAAAGAAAWLARDPSAGDTLTALDPGEIRAFTVTYPREPQRPPLHLARREDGWHVTEPIARPARDGRVVTALAALTATPESCYDAGGRDRASFGLAPAAAVVEAQGTRLAFGARGPDGRRYVLAGQRLCLVPDQALPMLAAGLDGLALRGLLPVGTTAVTIETPAARAERATAASAWQLSRGTGDAEAWARTWRTARADTFALAPPQADLGAVSVRTSSGRLLRWRIAAREPDLVLVPADAPYGLVVPAARAGALLAPPAPGAS
jgi:hypothetical protein